MPLTSRPFDSYVKDVAHVAAEVIFGESSQDAQARKSVALRHEFRFA